MSAQLLRLLLAGEYICSIRYENEYAALQDPAERERVNDWLLPLHMRLARIGDEGAFFMAPELIGSKEITQIKNELLKFRDEYGPAILLLDFIRQTESAQRTMSPGEYIALYQLEEAVAQSTTIETELRGLMAFISNAASRNTHRENLRRLLETLARDGYVYLVAKDTETYRVTGKVEQLYAVLQFLEESKTLPASEVDDKEAEEQGDLLEDVSRVARHE